MVGLGKRLSPTRAETSVETAKQVSSVLEELGIPGAGLNALKHRADDDGVPVDGKRLERLPTDLTWWVLFLRTQVRHSCQSIK